MTLLNQKQKEAFNHKVFVRQLTKSKLLYNCAVSFGKILNDAKFTPGNIYEWCGKRWPGSENVKKVQLHFPFGFVVSPNKLPLDDFKIGSYKCAGTYLSYKDQKTLELTVSFATSGYANHAAYVLIFKADRDINEGPPKFLYLGLSMVRE